MWAVEKVDYQKSVKPEVVAYFLEEDEAEEYIAYLATVNITATKSKIRELHYTE